MNHCGNCGGDIGSSNSVLACHCPSDLCSPTTGATVIRDADPRYTVTVFESESAYEAWLAAHRGNEGPPRKRVYTAADARREFSWIYTESRY